jgi:riboflavin kinase/FMN adenylyltransferase
MASSSKYLRVNDLSEVSERQPTYLAIGSFDGVHLGHQKVLRKLVAAARENGARSAVLTFFPHPKRVLQNLKGRYYLTTLPERVALLAQSGVDLIITHPFTDEVRRTRAADFVEQLRHYLNMQQLWGGKFALGYKREGDVPFLRELGQEKGFTVEVTNVMVKWHGQLVSSSRVRHGLATADIADVTGCLGRYYAVSGEVVRGDMRGRTIGFPTANLDEWQEQCLPANGVYATYAWIGDERFAAATNVGVRPTVNGRGVTVEAHLLDFEDDLYGQEIRVEFVSFIRPEKRFAGLDALKAQIAADVIEIRQVLD